MGTQRLFQLNLRLLSGEQVTAAGLAEELGASERTIYRNVPPRSRAEYGLRS